MTNTELREKLAKILREVQYLGGLEYQIADRLIAEGMTINVPQKPIGHKVEHAPVKIGRGIWSNGTTVYTCPKCGILISKIYDYCAKCGQHIDWSNLHELPKGE